MKDPDIIKINFVNKEAENRPKQVWNIKHVILRQWLVFLCLLKAA